MATPIPENQAQFTLQQVLETTGGQQVGSLPSQVMGVCTDSRMVRKGNLFIALSGEKFDGHDFVFSALDKGAAAAIVERAEALSGHAGIVVDDSLAALGALARLHRDLWGNSVIAITGSVGKTTTKNMVAAVLEVFGAVHKTAGNLNNRIGLPHTLFALQETRSLAVLELGTSEPGEIDALARIASPNIAVITAIEAVHLLGLHDIEGVFREKSRLFEHVDPQGSVIFNSDNEWCVRAGQQAKVEHKIGVGFSEGSQIQIEQTRIDPSRYSSIIRLRSEAFELASTDFEVNSLGVGVARAVAISIAVALAYRREKLSDTELQAIKLALASVSVPEGRLNIVEPKPGFTVIDDSYNANPASFDNALSVLQELCVSQNRSAVLIAGDMRELGVGSNAAHQALFEKALAQTHIKQILAVGEQCAQGISDKLIKQADGRIRRFSNTAELISSLSSALTSPGIVLIKGSRAVGLEQAVAHVLKLWSAS